MASPTTVNYLLKAHEQGYPAGAAYLACTRAGVPGPMARQLAEEAAAEAYARALVADQFSDEMHFFNWLALTARRWVVDELRKRGRSRQAEDEDWWPAPEQEVDEMLEALPHLEDALEQLPPDERAVVRLTYLERLTLEQTADRLGWAQDGSANAKTLKVWRARNVAIERLRGYLER